MRKFVFADEAGDFEFSRKQNVSKYFIACAIKVDSCDIGLELLKLRRELLWNRIEFGDYFHATSDAQAVRDRVFELINKYEIEIYAQILEKSKAQSQIRSSASRFYQYSWLYLFRHAMPKIITSIDDQLMVTAASIGTKKSKGDFSEAVRDTVKQAQKIDAGSWRTSFVSSASDPCLQIADYCTWAIQRKWERGDARSYELIKPKIKYEYDLWGHGTRHYY